MNFFYYMPTLTMQMPTQSCMKAEFSYFTDEEIQQLRDEGAEELAKALEDANAAMRKCDGKA